MSPTMRAALATRSQLEHEIKNQREINDHPPVTRLPFELLLEVFVLYTFSSSREDARIERYTMREEDSIFVIIRVCHHWREVALASPQLWHRVKFYGGDPLAYVNAMLSRSKTHALDIVLGTSSRRHTADALRSVFSNMNRISILQLTSCDRETMKELLPQAAPLLKQLSVEASFRSADTELSKLEACDMPSLENVSLSICPFSWLSPLLRPTLTHLSLSYLSHPQDQAFSDMLGALEVLTLLRELKLTHVLSAITPDERLLNRIITLPSLQDILIQDSTSSIKRFLRHLVFPTSANITLMCAHAQSPEGMLGEVADKLTGIRSIGIPLHILSAALSSPNGTDIFFACYTVSIGLTVGVEPSASSDSHHTPALSIYLGFSHEEDITNSIPRTMLRGLPASALTTLCLTLFDSYVDVGTWFDCCAFMTRVEELTVGSWGQDTFPLALAGNISATRSAAAGSRTRAPLFPRLQKLRMERVTLYGQERGDAVDGDSTPVDKYRQALVVRRSTGIPLQELIIVKCYEVKQHDVEHLSNFVAVRWDGVSLKRVDSDAEGTDEGDEDEIN